MIYIALSITTLLTIFFGVAYNEQKLKTERYRKLSNELFNKLVKKGHGRNVHGEVCRLVQL